jgi:hypothetical protein
VSRVVRLRRRAGHDAAIHERARRLAAEQLDRRLEFDDATWLDQHLGACRACRSIATAYETDRRTLRSLRGHEPEPPRDLWARTSAALERESARRGRAGRRQATGSSRRVPALGVLSGVAAVVVIVVGASVLSGGFRQAPSTAVVPSGTPPPVAVASTGTRPGATPIAVGAASVGWIGTASNGRLAYNSAAVDEVCPVDRQPDCPAVAGRQSKPVDLTVRPKSVSRSPVRNEAVVVTDGAASDSVMVITLPATEPGATPTPAETVKPSQPPTETPATSPDGSQTPPSSPSVPATSEPTPAETPVATPDATPSEPVDATPSPLATPEATAANSLAIVSGVRVVGESAAYSPNGEWFAFTARPSDDSAGPDIYVWRVGDDRARVITNDHASVFASWAGKRLIGSRPTVTRTETAEVSARSFAIDPATGAETELDGTAWRPVVDPTSEWALTWDGTVSLSTDGLSIAPATGSLVLRKYSPRDGIETGGGKGSVVTDATGIEFDARWDDTGTWLAIWLADSSDPSLGRLSLHHFDPATGTLERLHGAPKDVTALPGFSIGDGRLAWATPPGQGGEGSRVQIVAWTGEAVGAVESAPVDGVVVIH